MWALWIFLLLTRAILSPATIQLIIKEVTLEQDISTLAIQSEYCPASWLQELLEDPPVPVLLLPLNRTSTRRIHYSRELQVICLPTEDLHWEQELIFILRNVHPDKILLYAASERLLEHILMQLYGLRILNVIGLVAKNNQEYYRYSAYPGFQLERHALEHRPFYLTEFPNMKGETLMVLPDQKHPRTIIHKDKITGSQLLSGSIGHFVKTLAWKLNATLKWPEQVQPGYSLHIKEMLDMAEELRVDIPASMVTLSQPEQLPYMTYPFELSHICLMIPIAQPLPIRDIYLILCSLQHIFIAVAMVYGFGWLLTLHRQLTGQPNSCVDWLLNDVSLRGLLGQSFGQRVRNNLCSNWIYVLLGFLGLNVSSIHEAALGTLLTHPPKHFQPRSFADVRRVHLPLVVDAADVDDNMDELLQLKLDVMPVNFKELNQLRDNMNMSYVYFASRLKWTLLNAQQKYFPHEVFLYSMDACISPLTLMAFQLPNNSWFEEPITRLTLSTRASGLFQHWVESHFYDMVNAGLISYKDPLERDHMHIGGPLRLEDLFWIGVAYAALLTVAGMVFVGELIVARARRK